MAVLICVKRSTTFIFAGFKLLAYCVASTSIVSEAEILVVEKDGSTAVVKYRKYISSTERAF